MKALPNTIDESAHINQSIPEHMSVDELLDQKGWFLLKDVFQVLAPGNHAHYKLAFKQIQRIVDKGDHPFSIMGHRKIAGRVMILMERFAPWYRNNPIFQIQKLGPELDFQDFITLEHGFFRLSEVCHSFGDFLPFSYTVMKRHADREPDSQHAIGIFKFDKTYMIAMPRFRVWLYEQLQ